MKRIFLISALAMFFFGTLTVSTGCGDDPEPVPVDTTDNGNNNPVTTDLVFTLNGETKSVVVDTVNSYGQYSSVDERTTFNIVGRTTEKNELIEVEISFKGNTTGTYTKANGAGNIELNVGEGVRLTQYAPKPREEIEINVTTLEMEGGRCIGTFSGELQAASLATGDVTNGSFNVRRIEDL